MINIVNYQCKKCLINLNEEKIAIISQVQKYCQECLQDILNQQQLEVKNLQERFIFYKQFESSLDQNQLIFQSQTLKKNPQQNLQEQLQTTQMLQEQLRIINNNYNQIMQKCSDLSELIYNMEIEQIKFWESINRFDKRAMKLEQKVLTAKFDKSSTKLQLDGMSQKSIVHNFFSIQIDDNIGFVYGLAMGKKSQTVDINWQDFNSALGHICLGFHFLITKYGFKYEFIQEIKLKGSLTEIRIKDKKQFVHVAYIGRQHQKVFGEVLEILLKQLLYLTKRIRQSEYGQQLQEMRLPFQIDEKQMKIGQYYIDPTKIQEKIRWTNWTKAMRYFLINFKHVLTMYSLSDKLL